MIAPASTLYRLHFHEDHDQGDPYILTPSPEAQTRFQFYVYTTGEDPVTGRAFPVYGSHDLVSWQRLDEALVVGVESSH